MDKYITVTQATEALCRAGLVTTITPCLLALKTAPDADVVPTAPAYWEFLKDTAEGKMYGCSRCARNTILPKDAGGASVVKWFPYCHCGAKMHEKRLGYGYNAKTH